MTQLTLSQLLTRLDEFLQLDNLPHDHNVGSAVILLVLDGLLSDTVIGFVKAHHELFVAGSLKSESGELHHDFDVVGRGSSGLEADFEEEPHDDQEQHDESGSENLAISVREINLVLVVLLFDLAWD